MKSIQQLISDTTNPDRDIREIAVGEIGEHPQGKEAVPCLISVLQKDSDGEVRAYAAGALSLLRDPFSIPPLLEALNDKHARVRATAVWALTEMREKKAVAEMAKLMRDPDEGVRIVVAECLGKYPKSVTLDYLLELLKDKSINVQMPVVRALSSSDNPRAIAPLKALITSYTGRHQMAGDGYNIVRVAEQAIKDINKAIEESNE
jgi:HEAT repeat protein